jgi:UDP-glucose:(heptosyl)LPS alpha-1,3-glucosyltransferase
MLRGGNVRSVGVMIAGPLSLGRMERVISLALKIALVILHADPARGGAERYTADLAAGLRGRGHEVAVVSADGRGQGLGVGGQGGEGDVWLAVGGATRAGRYVRFLDAVDRHLGEVRYDVVHAMLPVRQCDVYHPHAGIAAAAVAEGHLKYGGTVRQAAARLGSRFNQRRQKFAEVERVLLTGADAPIVLCLSEYVKGFVRRYCDLPAEKLATLFNAVDLQKFDPARWPGAGAEVRRKFGLREEDVVALMIAQDFARKGLREAIGALARVADARLKLLVVGKEEVRPYRDLAAREKVSDRVIFAGPTDDPYAFYQSADFFVLPTKHDPCSLVVLEALAMGLPVISTVFNGACEIMTSGKHGYVLNDPADAAAGAKAMQSLLDGGTRLKMREACMNLRSSLSYESHLDRLLAIHRSLCGE